MDEKKNPNRSLERKGFRFLMNKPKNNNNIKNEEEKAGKQCENLVCSKINMIQLFATTSSLLSIKKNKAKRNYFSLSQYIFFMSICKWFVIWFSRFKLHSYCFRMLMCKTLKKLVQRTTRLGFGETLFSCSYPDSLTVSQSTI